MQYFSHVVWHTGHGIVHEEYFKTQAVDWNPLLCRAAAAAAKCGTLDSLDGVPKGTYVCVHVAAVSPDAAQAVSARVAAYMVRMCSRCTLPCCGLIPSHDRQEQIREATCDLSCSEVDAVCTANYALRVFEPSEL